MSTWGLEPFGINAPWGTRSPDTDQLVADGSVASAEIYAKDFIEVTLSVPVRNNATLKSTDSWTVTGSVSGNLEVRAVRSGDAFVTNVVYLAVQDMQVGETVTVYAGESIRTKTGGVLESLQSSASFVARRTKIDSMVGSRPSMYDVRVQSLLRNILNAIGRQDDLIGGHQDEEESP